MVYIRRKILERDQGKGFKSWRLPWNGPHRVRTVLPQGGIGVEVDGEVRWVNRRHLVHATLPDQEEEEGWLQISHPPMVAGREQSSGNQRSRSAPARGRGRGQGRGRSRDSRLGAGCGGPPTAEMERQADLEGVPRDDESMCSAWEDDLLTSDSEEE